MRIKQVFATAAVLAALTSVTACEDGDKEAAPTTPAAPSPAPSASSASSPAAQDSRASLGLPSAGSLAELRKLVHDNHSVDCTKFSTDPATVAVRSIDYLPAIEGDHQAWGVSERGLCGETGGERRAHGLTWLDKVRDMAAFQARAKEAQLKELTENGRIKATRSKVLVGADIAVETNDKSARHGLYQQRFLALNCESGFTAPQGYRLEKALVEGCVLTNYEG
ncbi:hypothetical protein [Streptomyces sp. NPDC053048]|uniref:hypothetical protein n=1 Tax=Streptomyces sp. NPDC053048 TaxID=3365694 RepID=UPI0037D8537B